MQMQALQAVGQRRMFKYVNDLNLCKKLSKDIE